MICTVERAGLSTQRRVATSQRLCELRSSGRRTCLSSASSATIIPSPPIGVITKSTAPLVPEFRPTLPMLASLIGAASKPTV